MSAPSRFADDLHYVRGVLKKPTGTPASIAMLWAAIGAPGFALVDLAADVVPWYWLVAGPAGTAASIWLGYRDGVRRGQLDRATGMRWTWHFVSLLGAIAAVVLLAMAGVFPYSAINSAVLLLLAVGYLLAGVHLDRRLVWVGAAFVVGLPLTALLPRFGWTAAGALVAMALIAIAASGRNRAHA